MRCPSYLGGLGKTSFVIGIDVGATSVKAAQVVGSLKGWSLQKIARAEIPPPSSSRPVVENIEDAAKANERQAAIVLALKEALAGMNARRAKIVSVVSCPKTFTRNLIMPLMPRGELAEAVRWEASNSVPFPLEEAVWDFAVTGEVADKGVKKLSLALAASPRETVGDLLSVFSQCGLEVASLIPVSEALRSLLARSHGRFCETKQNAVSASGGQGEETVAVVEMGASMTEFNIYRHALPGRVHLVFSRKLSVCARNITEALRTTLVSEEGKVDLSLEEAEEIKRKCGLPDMSRVEGLPAGRDDLAGAASDAIEATGADASAGTPALRREHRESVGTRQMIDGKIAVSQVLSLIRPEVEQLAGDIGGSLDFYREESRGGRVDRILLFGGGAALKGLAVFLKGELGVEVSVGDAFLFPSWKDGALVPSKAVPATEARRGRQEDPSSAQGGPAPGGQADSASQGPAAGDEKAFYLFGLAIGAAMHGVQSSGRPVGAQGTDEKNINLLPLELKEKTKRILENISLKAVTTGVVVIALLSYAWMRVRLGVFEKKLEAAGREYQSLSPQFSEYQMKILMEGARQRSPHWQEVLKELSHVVGDRMYLVEMNAQGGTVSLKGVIRGGEDAEIILSQFMLTLEKGLFKNVKLVTSRKKETAAEGSARPGSLKPMDDTSAEFEIVCEVE